jgi:polyhydroxyalkanoate synthesis regulator phasin
VNFDFSQMQTVDSIEKVPEDFRGLYAESGDGKYALRSDDPGVKSAVSAITRLNTSLKAARTDAQRAAAARGEDLAPLSEFGSTPAEIAEAVNGKIQELEAKLEGATGKKADEINARIEKLKNDLMGTHKREIDAREERIKALHGQLHTVLVSDSLTKEAVAAGVDDPELFAPFVTPSLKAIEENGKLVVRVVDDGGDVRISGVTGEPMTIKERVAELKSVERYARFFSSEAPSGGGGRTQRPNPQRPAPKDMTAAQKISEGLRKGGATRADGSARRSAGAY